MSFKHEVLFEQMVMKMAEEFKDITGEPLSIMRCGKIMSELNWASSQKK